MDTPFYDAICALAAEDKARFHMPGHKGNPAAQPFFGDFLRYDLTEIEGADDVSHPSGPLAQSEENMRRAFGSGATLYSASGASSCVLAMLTLFLRPGQPVVMARGCHASAVRALAFLDATPHWVLPQNGYIQPHDIDAALGAGGAKVVYLTSPDYYGRMADIPALAAVCARHGAKLLVDNAHGAYLRFLQPDRHPLSLGADATADSAHKTLHCLTPAALLHLRDAALAPAARRALNLYSSTSPAYPVLLSLDLAAGTLLHTPPDFTSAAARLQRVATATPWLVQPGDDPLRLTLCPAGGGWHTQEVYTALVEAGIHPELYNGTQIVLMASPWNREADFVLLEQILAQFSQLKKINNSILNIKLPLVVCSIRQALFAESQQIPVEQAHGRVAASIDAPCPPGVPLVLPGEVFSTEAIALLKAGGILLLDVVK